MTCAPVQPARVWIRGNSLLCALGNTRSDIAGAVRDQKTPFTQMPLITREQSVIRPFYRFHSPLVSPECTTLDNLHALLFNSIDTAVRDASLAPHELRECALFICSTSRDIPVYESDRRPGDSTGPMFDPAGRECGRVADRCAEQFGIRGPVFSIATACTSAANALVYATAMIRSGAIARALVVGYDLYSDTSQYGFESMMLITAPPYRPLDKNRGGIIMGEAVGTIVLDTVAPSAPALEILGGATLCDTGNVTTHTPDGSFIAQGIRRAFIASGVKAEDIDCVKAHATGTSGNDSTECNGLRTVFGNSMPAVTGLKGYCGHTVGAAGVTETLILQYCLTEGFIPATIGFSTPDEALGVVPLLTHRTTSAATILQNYFGFGGNCSSVIVRWGADGKTGCNPRERSRIPGGHA